MRSNFEKFLTLFKPSQWRRPAPLDKSHEPELGDETPHLINESRVQLPSLAPLLPLATRLSIVLPLTAGVVWLGYSLWRSPPVVVVARGELVQRTNQFTGQVTEWRDGSVFALPGLYHWRRIPLRDQLYRPTQSGETEGTLSLQSIEGLTLSVELSVRYAVDASHSAQLSSDLPADWNTDILAPAVQGAVFKIFPGYTVREIFSSKRTEILAAVEADLRQRLVAGNMILRSVSIGSIKLPSQYREGMERLLAEELASEKMRYTLELKEKNVKAASLEAEAEKVRNEAAAQSQAKAQLIEAQAQGEAQVIDAKAQAQAMEHILPFKRRQIEQRQLEAEAEKVSRVKAAEGNAAARVIEAGGEAESRQKLADAEWYRQERMGKLNSQQMERDGALVTQYPLLIQKTMADKLSDKINVIIAAPPASGGFIGNALIGGPATTGASKNPQAAAQMAADAGFAQASNPVAE